MPERWDERSDCPPRWHTRPGHLGWFGGGRLESGYYTRVFAAEVRAGGRAVEAGVHAAQSYLDGKPRGMAKSRTIQAERDRAFAASPFLKELPAEAWSDEALVGALARLVGQDDVAVGGLLKHVATVSPAAVRRAVRLSGLVLRPDAPHRHEVERLAMLAPDEFGDFNFALDAVAADCRRCRERVDRLRQPLAGLSPLELLTHASLYAFKHVVAPQTPVPSEGERARIEAFWYAINRLFVWKLGTADGDTFRLTERGIGECMAAHLSPVLFPTPGGRRRTDLEAVVEELMDAEAELQEAERSAEIFCYEDAAEFVRRGDRVEFVVRDASGQDVWRRNDERLTRLQRYWYMRGMEAFLDSGLAAKVVGRPEHHDWNRMAYIKAMATQLRLSEVYGVGDTVSTETGKNVPLFKALLSRELVTAFGELEFLMPFREHLARTGNWAEALHMLALGGFADGMQNRLPLTFSRGEDKIRNLVGWTVSEDRPRGSRRESRAIVDFWTTDWGKLAGRLQRSEPGLAPELFERPFVKLGQYLFELPWVSALQNNQTAAINNLRRLGSRRPEARSETSRIEERLATLFRERGFGVRLNWLADGPAGEVDLVCARDGSLLVLEVKSSYMRRSLRDAWLHGAMGLRLAGLQLQRKVPAVVRDPELVSTLGAGPKALSSVRAWIVDTSIEHDHERFGGFLKISLEELIVALRDDWNLLMEGDRVFAMDAGLEEDIGEGVHGAASPPTLYPNGFSFARFVEVVESGSVWKRSGAS